MAIITSSNIHIIFSYKVIFIILLSSWSRRRSLIDWWNSSNSWSRFRIRWYLLNKSALWISWRSCVTWWCWWDLILRGKTIICCQSCTLCRVLILSIALNKCKARTRSRALLFIKNRCRCTSFFTNSWSAFNFSLIFN